MCRLLAVRDSRPFGIAELLRPFAEVARSSREYQGHGWGCVWQDGNAWRSYHAIVPIWEDDVDRFGETCLLLAHARSAFRNEGIVVDNNMPFLSDQTAFIFNGELHGVRIRENGRIGAEKLFRFLLKHGSRNGAQAARRAVDLVRARSRFIRAMNFMIAERSWIQVYSYFSEAPDYFTLHVKQAGTRLTVCSEPFAGESGWVPFGNDLLEVFG